MSADMPKKMKASPRRLESRVLELLPASAAHRRIDGFAFESSDDDLFALGYPHLGLLYDDEADPVVTSEKLILGGYPYREVAFPRRAAIALLRAHRGGPATAISASGKPGLTEKAVLATKDTRDLELSEASELVDSFALSGDPSSDVFLYLVEALLGTERAVSFAIDAIAKLPLAGFFRRSHVAAQWLTTIRLMLDRLPDGDALADKVQRWADSAALDPTQRAFTGVGTLFGEERVEAPYVVVRASAERVLAARSADRTRPWYTLPDPRLVFLGGDGVYEIELNLWPNYGPPYAGARAHQLILERFGRIRSPHTVVLASVMAEQSKAKKEAAAWLEQHREYAVPQLEALATARGSGASGP